MTAEIKRTNSGVMYIQLEADKNNLEELIDLTELVKRTNSPNYIIRDFGSSAGFFGRNKDKQLDYTFKLIIDRSTNE